MQEVCRIVNEKQNKRLLFAAYLQGKRDQLMFPLIWENVTSYGKYKVMKQFLKWYETLNII
jgi:hypothetical protein